MSTSNPTRLPIKEFAEKIRSESIPLGNILTYFSAASSISEDDLKEYIEEPVAALPPLLASQLPKTLLLLVPYIERVNGRGHGAGEEFVAWEKPAEAKAVTSAETSLKDESVLAFAVSEQHVADFHYTFYRAIAILHSRRAVEDPQLTYYSMLRDELNAHIHGEVDEDSWRLKQGLLRRQTHVRRDTKPFQSYARQSLIDTLTLYLHGICCDIDVETGPRQLPSRFLRKRLHMLQGAFPPPKGYAVFPEELNKE